jgi:hypothetical protein
VLGIVLLKFGDIINFYNDPGIRGLAGFLLVLITALCLLSLFFVFSVVYPYFGNLLDKRSQQDSLIYFGSVSKMSAQEYFDRISRSSFEGRATDLANQATILASARNTK